MTKRRAHPGLSVLTATEEFFWATLGSLPLQPYGRVDNWVGSILASPPRPHPTPPPVVMNPGVPAAGGWARVLVQQNLPNCRASGLNGPDAVNTVPEVGKGDAVLKDSEGVTPEDP